MAQEWQQPEQPVVGYTAQSFVFGPGFPSLVAYQPQARDPVLFWDLGYTFDEFRDHAAEPSSSKFLDGIKELAVQTGMQDALHLRGSETRCLIIEINPDFGG